MRDKVNPSAVIFLLTTIILLWVVGALLQRDNVLRTDLKQERDRTASVLSDVLAHVGDASPVTTSVKALCDTLAEQGHPCEVY